MNAVCTVGRTMNRQQSKSDCFGHIRSSLTGQATSALGLHLYPTATGLVSCRRGRAVRWVVAFW